MKAIILSAGKGERVRDLNRDSRDREKPKVLLEILGKPMIVWNIELLKRYGVKDIAINTHYMAEKIKGYLGNGESFGVRLNYSYEPELLGTSGALNNFRDFFNERFFVLYGDVISQMNLEKLVKFHEEKGGCATLVVHKTDHPEDSDIVTLGGDERVIGLAHKPGNSYYGNLGNAALYVAEPQILNYVPEGRSDFAKDIFKEMMKAGEKLYGYRTNEFIKDAGTPERIKKVEAYQEYLKYMRGY